MDIRVLLVKPGEEPKVETIDNKLEGCQKAIGGGYIQQLFIDDVVLICDEEGKLKNLPPNRDLREYDDIIEGTFFISRLYRGEYVDLTDADIEKYTARFKLTEEDIKRWKQSIPEAR
jgi:hypothetical protein